MVHYALPTSVRESRRKQEWCAKQTHDVTLQRCFRVAAIAVAAVMVAAPSVSFGAQGVQRRPMALMVFFDGARADCLANAECPALQSLINGTWSPEYKCAWSDSGQNLFDAPTLSYPNHTSIMCGVTAAKHHIMNNEQVRVSGGKHRWPTWLSHLVNARPGLKAHSFFSDRNDALITPDPAVPMTVAKDPDYRLHDDETAAAAVAAYSGGDAPDAAMLFFHYPDPVGHYHGYYPMSDGYLAAFTHSDANLGRVLDAIRSRPTFDSEDWMITFTSDHGGKYLGHGNDDGHCHTVTVLVVGRNVSHGRIAGCPRTYDLPVTMLAHFGVQTEGSGMDGRRIGFKPGVRDAATPPDGSDLRLVSFDDPMPHAMEAAFNGDKVSMWGYADRLFTGLAEPSASGDRPVSAGYGRVMGREVPAAFRLGLDLPMDRGSFSLAFWMLDEGGAYDDDPIVLGNKDFFHRHNAGFTEKTRFPGFGIFLRTKSDDGSRGVTLHYTCDNGVTMRTLGAFSPERGRWNFYAMSVEPQGRVVFCQGRSDGRFNWIAADSSGVVWDGGGPIMVGQDKTGQYHCGADLCFDELRAWPRPLSTTDLKGVFDRDRRRK